MGVDARPIRAILTLAALAAALVNAACVTTEPSSPAATAPGPAAEPAPSAYVSMLRSQGVETAIPARGKFVLVNIPSFELIALQDGVPAAVFINAALLCVISTKLVNTMVGIISNLIASAIVGAIVLVSRGRA